MTVYRAKINTFFKTNSKNIWWLLASFLIIYLVEVGYAIHHPDSLTTLSFSFYSVQLNAELLMAGFYYWPALLLNNVIGLLIFLPSFYCAKKALPGNGKNLLMAFLLPFVIWPYLTAFLNPVSYWYYNHISTEQAASESSEFATLVDKVFVTFKDPILVAAPTASSNPKKSLTPFSKSIQVTANVTTSVEGNYTINGQLLEATASSDNSYRSITISNGQSSYHLNPGTASLVLTFDINGLNSSCATLTTDNFPDCQTVATTAGPYIVEVSFGQGTSNEGVAVTPTSTIMKDEFTPVVDTRKNGFINGKYTLQPQVPVWRKGDIGNNGNDYYRVSTRYTLPAYSLNELENK